ncbi:hypothetical protein [Photobacterium damselae]|uniref:hypothetical protein n=1 Tax=Photobacterium damselae TaxID=38293 RepID=UPI001EFDD759|nr:hypothetical protein [Photobacterium damselae]MCG9780456.1 hypothetical protein [Photobacterium damselae]
MSNVNINPGMGLNLDELAVLHGHAVGKSPAAIGKDLDLTGPEIKLIEQDIRFKLHAKTPMHMITRAFELGILKTLCLVLCLSAVIDLDEQAARVRGRSRNEISRVVRSGRDGAI